MSLCEFLTVLSQVIKMSRLLNIRQQLPNNGIALDASHLRCLYSSVDLRVPVNIVCCSSYDEEMESDDVRLNTFLDWPLITCTNPNFLAGNGLYYTGTGTRLQCVYCNGIANYSFIGNALKPDREIHYLDCVSHHGQRVSIIFWSTYPLHTFVTL